MAVNRKKLGAVLCALLATAVVVSVASASHTSTPGVTKHQVTIGGTFPFTGPAQLYKTIPAAELAYYAWVNTHGKVNHRTINDITLDDQYDPSQTPAKTKELVEQDHVFAVVGSLGTAPVLSTWNYLNKRKVPQALVATGDAYWGQCAQHKCAASKTAKPWTMGWQPDYPGEAKVYAQYILRNKPQAKIGVLYQNDAYGTNYLNGLKAGLGTKHQSQIVDQESYNVGDSAQLIAAHLVTMRGKGADTLVVFATPTPTIQALVGRTAIGWSPLTIINNVSANRIFLLAAANNPSPPAEVNGVISTTYLTSATTQASLPGMKLAKKIIDASGNAGLQQSFAKGDSNIVYGLAVAWTFVDALKHAGKNPTRASFMHALRTLDESKQHKNPFVYPGMVVKTSNKRTFPMEQLKPIRWAGGNTGDWQTFGRLYSQVK